MSHEVGSKLIDEILSFRGVSLKYLWQLFLGCDFPSSLLLFLFEDCFMHVLQYFWWEHDVILFFWGVMVG